MSFGFGPGYGQSLSRTVSNGPAFENVILIKEDYFGRPTLRRQAKNLKSVLESCPGHRAASICPIDAYMCPKGRLDWPGISGLKRNRATSTYPGTN